MDIDELFYQKYNGKIYKNINFPIILNSQKELYFRKH